MKRKPGLSTLAVHGQPARRTDWVPVVAPIYQSSTFTNPVGSDEMVMYTRYGNNPNQVALASKYALLEGAEAAIFVASGMGATALAHLAVLRPGDHLLSSSWIYGGTRRLFDEEFGRLGIEVTYVNPDQPRQWRRSVRKSTRAVFVETPTNPVMRVIDLAPMAQIARDGGFALLVDATFASPDQLPPARAWCGYRHHQRHQVPQRPQRRDRRSGRRLRIDHRGSDPADAALGTVDRPARRLAHRAGDAHARGPDGAPQHQRHGRGPLGGAADRDRPGPLSRPPLPPGSRLCEPGPRRLWRDGRPRAQGRCPRGGEVPQEAQAHHPRAEPGGVESLISEPRLTSHSRLSEEQRLRQGIPDGFVRLSCGVEDAEDIIADLEQALG